VDANGRTILIVDAVSRWKRFRVRAHEKLTAFLELAWQFDFTRKATQEQFLAVETPSLPRFVTQVKGKTWR
jgi:hypothetical protein